MTTHDTTHRDSEQAITVCLTKVTARLTDTDRTHARRLRADAQ